MKTVYEAYMATDKIRQIKLNYPKDISLKSQILFSFKNVNLLNVSKTYTQLEYVGVNFLLNVKNDLFKLFRDVNSGYTEKLVDDKNKLFKDSHFLHTMNKINEAYINTQTVTTECFTFSHNDETVRCEKIFIDGEYCFSNYYTRGIVSRGAYAGKGFTRGSKFDTIFYKANDHNAIKSYYTNRSYVGLSNTYSYISTEYSTIKPYY